MLRLFTIITFSLFISGSLSAEYVDKGCAKKGCTEYEWYNKGRFNPLTIHWPLHYTGEVYRDRRDGGAHDIEIVYGGQGGAWYQYPLHYYRQQPHCPSPYYMSEGVQMHPSFECVNEAYDKPSWKNSPCSDIFSSYEDTPVYVDGPACSKIIREWTIVDWCTYKPNTRANTQQDRYVIVHDTYKDKAHFAYGRGKHDVEYDGWYSFKQVIKIVDKHAPEMVSCDDVVIELKNGKCEAQVKLKNKIVDAGPCAGDKMTVEAVVKNSSGKVVSEKWVNARHNRDFDTHIGYLDAGHYTVHWKFQDGCGNSNICVQKISIEDKSAPHLLCIKDISTSISDDHGTAIWAEDFAFKVTGSCDPEDVSVSFREDEFVPSLAFNCDDDLGIQDLTVYAIDGNGNVSSCNVELFVADHNACGEGMQIAGEVFNREYQALQDVNIEVVKGDEVLVSVMSNEKGRYNLSGIPNEKSQTLIKPSKKDDSGEGLDATDLLVLLRHITRVESLDNILEYAAADVNSDGAISLDDYWALAAMVYDLPTRDPNISSWKFFDAKMYEGGGVRRASKLVVPIPVKFFKHRYDIMGIRNGDIDFSSLNNQKANWRSAEQLTATYDISSGIAGTSINLDMSTLNAIGAVTLTLENTSASNLSGVIAGGESIVYFAKQVGKDLAVTIMDEDGFDLNVSLLLSNSSDINTTSTAISIHGQDDLGASTVQWSKIENGAVEMTAAPNPFNEQLLVSYFSDVDGIGSLELVNISGQRLLSQDIALNRGQNELTLDTQELGSGIYLLKVSTATNTQVIRVSKNRP